MSMDRVEVLAVLRACEQLAGHRLTKQRREFDRMLARGRIPHTELAAKADRAAYIRDQVKGAQTSFAGLVEAAKGVAENIVLRDTDHGRAIRAALADCGVDL